jgi:hypothetical protein
LKNVVSVGLTPQNSAADPQDHGAVPQKQQLERRLVALVDETAEQLPVCDGDTVRQQGSPA